LYELESFLFSILFLFACFRLFFSINSRSLFGGLTYLVECWLGSSLIIIEMPWFFLGCNRPAELVSPCFEINRHMWYDFYAVFSLRKSRNWKIEEYIAAWFFFFFYNCFVLFQCSIYASLVSYWVLDWFLPTWSMLKICYLSISSGVAVLEWIYIMFLDMKMQKLIWYFLLNNLLFYLIKRNLVKLISNSSLYDNEFFFPPLVISDRLVTFSHVLNFRFKVLR
jgi:hypothetical protein